MLDYKLYINQIKEMIKRIEVSTKDLSLDDFKKDDNLVDSTLLRLQVIGESIKSVPYEIKKKNKQVKWKIFEKLRNFISHKYILVDKEIIWDIVKNKIPELNKQIESVK